MRVRSSQNNRVLLLLCIYLFIYYKGTDSLFNRCGYKKKIKREITVDIISFSSSLNGILTHSAHISRSESACCLFFYSAIVDPCWLLWIVAWKPFAHYNVCIDFYSWHWDFQMFFWIWLIIYIEIIYIANYFSSFIYDLFLYIHWWMRILHNVKHFTSTMFHVVDGVTAASRKRRQHLYNSRGERYICE